MKEIGKQGFLACAFLAGSVLCSAQSAPPIRVIEEFAIPYAGFLSKAAFDQRFPGEFKAAPAALESGWYVIYEHQRLNYYFGPILLESTGKDYLAQLTATVEAAVAQRPSIADYRLALSFEPSPVSSSEGKAPASASGTQPPKSPSGLWGLIKRIFSF
jgi:hypothetical protein